MVVGQIPENVLIELRVQNLADDFSPIWRPTRATLEDRFNRTQDPQLMTSFVINPSS